MWLLSVDYLAAETWTALLPGFQLSGVWSLRVARSGYHCAVSLDHVPSAITASRAELRASVRAWLSLATAYAVKFCVLTFFCAMVVPSPAFTWPSACCDGATHASIWPLFTFA